MFSQGIYIVHLVITSQLLAGADADFFLTSTTGAFATRGASWCQYRDLPFRYNAEIFRRQASYACYDYSRPSWFIPDGEYPATVLQEDNVVYQGINVNGTAMAVDFEDPVSVAIVAASFATQNYVNKWIECGKAAVQCCDWMLTLTNQDQLDGCGAVWDGWQCWRGANNDSVEHEVCPAFTYTSVPPSCNHYTSKECFSGVWNPQTETKTCDIRPRLRERILYHVIMMSVSLVFSLPAIVIFFYYRKLRESMRVILHRNLLLAIFIRNILSITSKTTILLDALNMNATEETISVMAANGVGCKILAVLEKLASNAVFVTMLLLGIYLHRLIAVAFRGEPNMFRYFIGGAVVNCVPVIAWTIVMATLNNHNCWTVDTGGYQWINDTPRIIMLLVNFVLIADIIRVLVTKLSSVKTRNSNNIRRTIKATIFLAPVFGVQFLFTAFRPQTTDCKAEQIYYFFSYGLDGIQGAVVSLIFCYLNKEVQTLLRRSMCPSTLTNQDQLKNTSITLVEPNHKNLTDPPTPILDVRCLPQRPATLDLKPRGGSILRRFSGDIHHSTSSSQDEYYTPRNSETGSPPPIAFYTPRSSIAGSENVDFYECIDDEPIVDYMKNGDYGREEINEGFAMEGARERSGTVFFDVDKI